MSALYKIADNAKATMCLYSSFNMQKKKKKQQQKNKPYCHEYSFDIVYYSIKLGSKLCPVDQHYLVPIPFLLSSHEEICQYHYLLVNHEPW